MAEILLLPVQPCGLNQLDRLHADLADAHERGTDLGPRAPHIRAGGERLHDLSRDLKRMIEDLDLTLIKIGLQDEEMGEALRGFVSAAESLADSAQRFLPTF
ncbi:MAG: hypothetical protein ABW003_23865 [Microvirga sp.]